MPPSPSDPASSVHGDAPASARASADLDDDDDTIGHDADDLFGDDDDDPDQVDSVDDDDHAPTTKKKRRHIDDAALDSGDDSNRSDRAASADRRRPETVQKQLNIADLDLPRAPVPAPSDGELYLLKVPDFLEIDPKAFSLSTFKPPVTDHRSRGPPSATFSAYGTATTTIRWRRSPSDPSELQSNARILRWSDGSLTLQLASDPCTQYELPANALAPPQANPKKPTPVSHSTGKPQPKAARKGYNAARDSFTYLARPEPDFALMRFVAKVTAGLQVQAAAGDANDDALERLQETMLAAQRAKDAAVEGTMLVRNTAVFEDPELAKKRAEAAERDKLKARRKLESASNRERERQSRALGRSGAARSGGLTVVGLEDDEAGGGGGGGRHARGRPSKPKARRRALRDEYSDEDDYAGRRTTKEDEYDMQDGFMADSDEEADGDGEVDSDEVDIDDVIDKQEKAAHRRERARSGTPKRSAPGGVAGGASPKAAKRRRVIDDDEDD